ncbi:MAG TPA: ABC transporter ATP-binding protein [Roseomonas sp.]|nr:ABC transporter ATP-binding protein [Roseomonas sp.]
MSGTPKLELREVSKSYTRPGGAPFTVLDRIALTVPDQEFLVILGPSGCGKSTLLKIIDGTETCSAGKVLLDGADVTGRPGTGRAMVFQGADLLPWQTALGNVMFGLILRGVPKPEARERAMRYLDMVGLTAFADSYPHQLSGGMQQRVGIARALAVEPELLLMDEPFGALDVQTRDLLQEELLRIWERDRKTVVFITHSIEEALYLGDRIVVMGARPGRIETVLQVPFPRPRNEGIRDEPEFRALRREIWGYLKTGAQAAPDLAGAPV